MDRADFAARKRGATLIDRIRKWASANPGAAGCVVFLAFALPTLAMPLFARDYYHLERARDFKLAEFWKADEFEFKEYFWWPFDGHYCRFLRPLWSGAVVIAYRIFGLSPIPHRLVWIAFHLASILLFAAVLRRSALGVRAVLVAVILFVVHPAWCSFALEPIAVGSANAMVTTLLFGSLLAFMRWRNDGFRPGFWLALAGCATALLVKEIGIIVAPVLLAYDLLIPSPAGAARGFLALARRHAATCGITALHFLVYVTIVTKGNHLRVPYYLTWSTPGFGVRMVHQIGLYFAHPILIGVYHPLADVELYMRHPAWFAAFVAAALSLYVLLLRRTWRLPWARFGVALLVLSLLPVLPVIVQMQEFALPSAAVSILFAIAFERAAPRSRSWLEWGTALGYAGVLVFALVFSATVAAEGAATYDTLRRVLPSVRPGTQIYFVNTNEYGWLGYASAVRLLYREPTLGIHHLSFDCYELPAEARTELGRAITSGVRAIDAHAVGSCSPRVVRLSDRSFSLELPEGVFFDSDLGRFALQGRDPFHVGETMRRADFEGRVDAMREGGVSRFTFVFDGPLEAEDRVFLRWDGTRLTRMQWEEGRDQ